MRTLSLVLRRTTLVLTALFAAGGLLFALGYAFEDPGGLVAVLLALAVVVPLAPLTLLAVFRRRLAGVVLVVALVLYAVWGLVSVFVDLVEAPDLPVIALALAVPVAVVRLTYPLRAGGLMLGLAAVPFVSVVARLVRESGLAESGLGEGGPEGPGLRELLGGSTGVVVLPLVFLAALLLLAAALGRRAPDATTRRTQPEPPRTVQPR